MDITMIFSGISGVLALIIIFLFLIVLAIRTRRGTHQTANLERALIRGVNQPSPAVDANQLVELANVIQKELRTVLPQNLNISATIKNMLLVVSVYDPKNRTYNHNSVVEIVSAVKGAVNNACCKHNMRESIATQHIFRHEFKAVIVYSIAPVDTSSRQASGATHHSRGVGVDSTHPRGVGTNSTDRRSNGVHRSTDASDSTNRRSDGARRSTDVFAPWSDGTNSTNRRSDGARSSTDAHNPSTDRRSDAPHSSMDDGEDGYDLYDSIFRASPHRKK